MMKKKRGKSLFNLTPKVPPFYNSNQAIFFHNPSRSAVGLTLFLKGTCNHLQTKELSHSGKGSHRPSELPEFPTISHACKLQN